MRADLHVHTRFSCDSEAQMCEYLRQAEEKKVDWMLMRSWIWQQEMIERRDWCRN